MIELLRAPSFGGGNIPDLAFFDITSDAVPLLSGTATSRVASTSSEDSAAVVFASGETGVAPLVAPVVAPVIAVWGPTGAPGRTSVAINVAAELSQEGLAVLLMDADPYGGTIAPKLGLLDETPGFAAVCRLADQELLTRHELQRLAQLVDVGGVRDTPLWVLTGILRTDRWPELSAARVARVLEFCRGEFDVIIVDVGFNVERDEEISSDLFAPRRNAATLTVLGEADTIVAVTDSDVVGLARFLRTSSDVRELFVGTPIIAVANRVRSAVAGLAPRTHVRQTLERFGGLTDIMVIPFDDRAFDACTLRSEPLCTVTPQSAARIALRQLALRLAPGYASASQSPSRETRVSLSTLFARRRG
nr:regulator [Alpinimonas psychrophila]